MAGFLARGSLRPVAFPEIEGHVTVCYPLTVAGAAADLTLCCETRRRTGVPYYPCEGHHLRGGKLTEATIRVKIMLASGPVE